MATSGPSFLRQLSEKEGWKSTSKRWGGNNNNRRYNVGDGQEGQYWKQQMEGLSSQNNMVYGNENGGLVMKKRVMVVVDQSSHSKHAMMWALTHVANKGDSLTLLHIVPAHSSQPSSDSPCLVSSLASLCKACKPEVYFLHVSLCYLLYA